MRKYLIIFIILYVSILCFASNDIAIAYKVKNDISLNRDDAKSEVNKGQLLQNGDKLSSGEKSYAAIKFVDGSSIIKLFPNSVLKITGKKDDGKLNKKSFLESGYVFSKIKKKMGKFEIETATSVASVKGTEFLIEVSKDGTTTVTTLDGEVILFNKASKESNSVPAGQQGVSSPDGEIGVEEFNPDDLDLDEIEETQELEIQMQNPDGDSKTIIIDME
ncbi:MAG: FecR family protein [Candidatus Cloacimonadota bacterium]|nr:FecR family protein [Candidatus Cloacimonadota bacterium]